MAKQPRKAKAAGPRMCRLCGCTQEKACFDVTTGVGCHWIEEDLCSCCHGAAIFDAACQNSRTMRGATIGALATMAELLRLAGTWPEAQDQLTNAIIEIMRRFEISTAQLACIGAEQVPESIRWWIDATKLRKAGVVGRRATERVQALPMAIGPAPRRGRA